MKTSEELNALREEAEALCGKLSELSEDELQEVTGGMKIIVNKGSSWVQALLQLFLGNKS